MFPKMRKSLKQIENSYPGQIIPVYKITAPPKDSPKSWTKLFKRKFKKDCEHYCLSCTLHGLKYVGDKTLTFFERFFWMTSFIVAVAFALFFIFNLYEKYDRSPVIISFNPKMVKISDIPFPAITICNVNMALKDLADNLNMHGSHFDRQLLYDMCNMDGGLNIPNGTNLTDDIGFPWPVVKNMIYGMNQKCTEMFKVCSWDGKIQDCDGLIHTSLTDEGYCCSFNKMPSNYSLRNYDEPSHPYPATIIDWNPEDGYPPNIPDDAYPYRSFGPGQSLGLTLVLDALLDQYYCTTTSSVGFKALLSTPIESPEMADIGMLIAPGQETRIAINVEIEDATNDIMNIDIRKRQCYFPRERELRFYRVYTKKNCRMECEANFTLELCGCVPYYLPRDVTTRVCGQKADLCANEAKFAIERFSKERAKCDCLPACFEITYYPLSTSMGKIQKEHKTVNRRFTTNVSYDYFAENMAVIHFYFSMDKFAKRTKSKMYGFPEFLSNTGGLLGLFLGFSFLSVVEVFYFICMSNLCKFLSQRQRRESPAPIYPYVN